MKLNKVLALALSGVMAVSMLAGCSGNSGNGGQEGEENKPVDNTGIVAQLDEAQKDRDADAYEASVAFVYNNDLQTALEQTVKVNGAAKNNESTIRSGVDNLMGYKPVNFADLNGADNKNGMTAGVQTAVTVQRVEGYTQATAMKQLAKQIANVLSSQGGGLSLRHDTNELTYTYSYTGDVAVYAAEQDGIAVYYAVAVVNCTTANPVVKVTD